MLFKNEHTVTNKKATPHFFKGAPTAILQSCPGSPCGGFMPGAVVVGAPDDGVTVGVNAGVEAGAEIVTGEGADDGLVILEIVAGAAGFWPGGEFKGEPTAISQRWPGSPCAGFIPAAVAVAGCCCIEAPSIVAGNVPLASVDGI